MGHGAVADYHVVRQSAGHVHYVLYCYGMIYGNYVNIAVGLVNHFLRIFPFGEIFIQRIRHKEFSLLIQKHCGGIHRYLCKGCLTENIVFGQRYFIFNIRISEILLVQHFAFFRYQA